MDPNELAQEAQAVLEIFPNRDRLSVQDFLTWYERFSKVYEQRAHLAPDLRREMEEDYPWVEYAWGMYYEEISDYGKDLYGEGKKDDDSSEDRF